MMPWVKYTNNIAPKLISKDLAIGWILLEDYPPYKKGKVIQKEMLPNLPKEVRVKGPEVKVLTQIRSQMGGEPGQIIKIKSKGKSRSFVFEMLGKKSPYCGPFEWPAPEFDPSERDTKKRRASVGNFSCFDIWVDEGGSDEEELGYEPEPDGDDDDLLKI